MLFLHMIDEAREIAGVPFVITSGFRTDSHNKEVRGVRGSAHTKGLAADIRYRRPRELAYILRGVFAAGFGRTGIGPNFVHIDIDYSKPVVYWDYQGVEHVA